MKALRRRSGPIAALASAAAALLVFAAAPALGQGAGEPAGERFVPGELLVRFDAGVSRGQGGALAGRLDARVAERLEIVPNLTLVDLPPGLGVARAERLFESLDGVRSAEPNVLRSVAVEPNDPFYTGGALWGLSSDTDADIDAPGAWGLATGDPDVTVGVIDTGASISHPDLEANIWTNPADVLDGVDGLDANPLIDDRHGYDFVNDDADPEDDHSHGTHVTGILGAVGNNGVGVTGVSWEVALMPLKAGDAEGDLALSDIIAAIGYAVENGAKVINASFTGNSFATAERNAIAAAPGVLFVAAAGNDGTDNDATPRYPCNYDVANIVCVAATNQVDNLSTFSSGGSNFGKASVDLAAPGSSIVSTLPVESFSPAVLTEDFEAGLADWTVDPPLTWQTAIEPPFAVGAHLTDSPGGNYAADTDAAVRLTTPLDLSAEDSCRMRFDLAHSIAAGDRLWVEASPDAAPGNWTALATYSGSKPLPSEEVVKLLGFSRAASVYLRFRLQTNSTGNADGVHIDDVGVECLDQMTSVYGPKSGTSMATPYVAGTAALLLDRYPTYTPAELRSALLANVDRIASLHCKVASGGRLNAFDALDKGVPATPPAEDCPPPATVPTPTPNPVVHAAPKPNKCKKIKDRRKRKKCNRKRVAAAG